MGKSLNRYRIEKAAPVDLDSLVSLLGELFALEPAFQVDPGKQRRGLELLIAKPRDAVIMVARLCANESVLGMATGQLVVSTAEGAPSLWVEDLIVRQRARAGGIGRALLAALVDWAHNKGATRAQLLADALNAPALAFYDHLGWQPVNMVPRRLRLLGPRASAMH